MNEEEIKKMFEYNGKLKKLLPKEYVERYRKTFLEMLKLYKNKQLRSKADYLEGNELAINIYKRKYYLKNLNNELIENKPEEVFIRIASFIAAVEKSDEEALYWAKQFYNDLFDGLWLPGGRVLAGAGDLYRLKTLANCFVNMIEDDSIESIYKTAYEAARTYSYGGGTGIDISVLRPAGSVVHNAADSSTGAASFMELYSLTTGLIGQSGRRGALMLTIDVKHPDVIRFIKAKSTPNWTTKQIISQLSQYFSEEQLKRIEKVVMENTQIRFANISIKITDEFMNAILEQNTYGKNKILVYKKDKGKVMDIPQDIKNIHYSLGIPSKDLSKYKLIKAFSSLHELNEFLSYYSASVKKEDLDNADKRDVYGDYVIELNNKDYDLAIRYSGDFLLYFASKEVGSIKILTKARDIWNLFIESNYKTAEPGLMFWSTLKKYSPSDYIGRPIVTTNPCSEVPLEDGGACNLGSINLSRFIINSFSNKAEIDYKRLKEAVKHLVRLLDNVVEWNTYLNPLEEQRIAVKQTRRVGMGVMGIADLFYQLSLDYDSREALNVLDKVLDFIANNAYQYSADIASEKGSFESFNYEKYKENPFFKALWNETKNKIKEQGLRNVALLSIAPTGTISNIVKSFEYNNKNYIGVSGGIEPVFGLFYNRRSESLNKTFNVFHSTVQAYLDIHNLNEKAQDATTEELEEILPSFFFKTAYKIDPLMRVKIQAVAQKHIDHSISSTVNLPVDIEPEVISQIYLEAWKSGLKGITIYREGSRFPILSLEHEKTEFEQYAEKTFKIKWDGKEIIVKGNELLELPDGRLTTVYHAIKNKLIG